MSCITDLHRALVFGWFPMMVLMGAGAGGVCVCEVTDSSSLSLALKMPHHGTEWVLRGEAHLCDAFIIAPGSGLG